MTIKTWTIGFLCLLTIISSIIVQPSLADEKINIEFFYSSGCGDCEEKEPIVDEIEQEYADKIVVHRKDISMDENYMDQWVNYGFFDIPAIVVNNKTKIPKEEITKEYVEKIIDGYLSGEINETNNQSQRVEIPFLGSFNATDLSRFSLPLLTVILGAVDSVNPCSFFVLMFLLNLLVYAQSRKKMAIIGGIFIFFSGFIYFIFMSALLEIFIFTSHVLIITTIAGFIAILLGSLNIKDFFFFKKGLSASIPDSKKPGLFKQMRKLVKASKFSTMLIGVIVLAVSANTYELFCTLGFPMIFTKTLTLHHLPIVEYYLYLVFYNIIYVIPLCLIVTIFVVTLGRRKLTQWQGQLLKLLSGTMMASLGLILVFSPRLLNNVFAAVGIIVVALLLTTVISLIWKKHLQDSGKTE
ncbi:MAG: hypothetical protein J7L32_02785 [Thermoplasmata archaeon]|nr:hypothetical protein [Thermoplasmata archaeon]